MSAYTGPQKTAYLRLIIEAIAIIVAMFALTLSCIYVLRTMPLLLSADSLFEAQDWKRGETLWEMFRHNEVGAWTQSIGLFLDIYIGPVSIWSRLINSFSLVVFGVTFWHASKSYMDLRTFGLLLAVFISFWFLPLNASQSHWYIWRLVESSSQLAALGLSVLLLSRHDTLNKLQIGLIILAVFLFTQVHLGYTVMVVLLPIMIIVEKRKNYRLGYAAISAAYLIYMFLIDGTFAELVGRLKGGESGGGSILDMGLSILQLASQFPKLVFSNILPTTILPLVQVVFLLSVFGLGIKAIYDLMKHKDKRSGVFLLCLGMALAAIFLIVMGRYTTYGPKIAAVPRYVSYSLIILMSTVWYCLSMKWTRIAIPVTAVLVLVGAITWAKSYKMLEHFARSNDFNISAYYTLILNNEISLPITPLNQKQSKALKLISKTNKDITPIIETINWETFQQDNFVDIDNVVKCEILLRQHHKGKTQNFTAWDYRYNLKAHEKVDYGVILDEGNPVGYARSSNISGRGHLRFFIRKDITNPVIVLKRRSKSGAVSICKIADIS